MNPTPGPPIKALPHTHKGVLQGGTQTYEKQTLFTLFFAILAMMSTGTVRAQEAYAVLDDAGTLTFYYDGQKINNRATICTMHTTQMHRYELQSI